MKTLTAIIYPGETGRWLVAHNRDTGTTSQGKTVEQALQNLKEATELFLEEKDLPESPRRDVKQLYRNKIKVYRLPQI